MPGRNFADPEYEPTDEDLAERMQEAFAGIMQARTESLAAMQRRIEDRAAKAFAELELARVSTRA